MLETRLIIL